MQGRLRAAINGTRPLRTGGSGSAHLRHSSATTHLANHLSPRGIDELHIRTMVEDHPEIRQDRFDPRRLVRRCPSGSCERALPTWRVAWARPSGTNKVWNGITDVS